MDPQQRDELVSDVQDNAPYGDADVEGKAHHKHGGLGKRIKHAVIDGPVHKLVPGAHDKSHGGSDEEDNTSWRPPEVPEHGTTQTFASAGGHAVLAQAMRELSEPRNLAVLDKVTAEAAGQIGRQLVGEPGRRGTRTIFIEAVAGTIDGLEKQARESMERLHAAPGAVWLVLLGAGAYGVALALGILIAIWRIALLGL